MAREEIEEILEKVEADPYQMQPMHDYVIVVYDEDEMKKWVTEEGSSILLPGADLSSDAGGIMKLAFCRVIRSGPGRVKEGVFRENQTKPGDMVAFCPRYATHEFVFRGRQYAMVPENEVTMVMTYDAAKDRGATGGGSVIEVAG